MSSCKLHGKKMDDASEAGGGGGLVSGALQLYASREVQFSSAPNVDSTVERYHVEKGYRLPRFDDFKCDIGQSSEESADKNDTEWSITDSDDTDWSPGEALSTISTTRNKCEGLSTRLFHDISCDIHQVQTMPIVTNIPTSLSKPEIESSHLDANRMDTSLTSSHVDTSYMENSHAMEASFNTAYENQNEDTKNQLIGEKRVDWVQKWRHLATVQKFVHDASGFFEDIMQVDVVKGSPVSTVVTTPIGSETSSNVSGTSDRYNEKKKEFGTASTTAPSFVLTNSARKNLHDTPEMCSPTEMNELYGLLLESDVRYQSESSPMSCSESDFVHLKSYDCMNHHAGCMEHQPSRDGCIEHQPFHEHERSDDDNMSVMHHQLVCDSLGHTVTPPMFSEEAILSQELPRDACCEEKRQIESLTEKHDSVESPIVLKEEGSKAVSVLTDNEDTSESTVNFPSSESENQSSQTFVNQEQIQQVERRISCYLEQTSLALQVQKDDLREKEEDLKNKENDLKLKEDQLNQRLMNCEESLQHYEMEVEKEMNKKEREMKKKEAEFNLQLQKRESDIEHWNSVFTRRESDIEHWNVHIMEREEQLIFSEIEIQKEKQNLVKEKSNLENEWLRFQTEYREYEKAYTEFVETHVILKRQQEEFHQEKMSFQKRSEDLKTEILNFNEKRSQLTKAYEEFQNQYTAFGHFQKDFQDFMLQKNRGTLQGWEKENPESEKINKDSIGHQQTDNAPKPPDTANIVSGTYSSSRPIILQERFRHYPDLVDINENSKSSLPLCGGDLHLHAASEMYGNFSAEQGPPQIQQASSPEEAMQEQKMAPSEMPHIISPEEQMPPVFFSPAVPHLEVQMQHVETTQDSRQILDMEIFQRERIKENEAEETEIQRKREREQQEGEQQQCELGQYFDLPLNHRVPQQSPGTPRQSPGNPRRSPGHNDPLDMRNKVGKHLHFEEYQSDSYYHRNEISGDKITPVETPPCSLNRSTPSCDASDGSSSAKLHASRKGMQYVPTNKDVNCTPTCSTPSVRKPATISESDMFLMFEMNPQRGWVNDPVQTLLHQQMKSQMKSLDNVHNKIDGIHHLVRRKMSTRESIMDKRLATMDTVLDSLEETNVKLGYLHYDLQKKIDCDKCKEESYRMHETNFTVQKNKAMLEETLDSIEKMEARMENMEAKLEKNNRNIEDMIKNTWSRMNVTYDRMEDRFNGIFDRVDTRYDKMEAKFDDIDNKIDIDFSDVYQRIDAIYERLGQYERNDAQHDAFNKRLRQYDNKRTAVQSENKKGPHLIMPSQIPVRESDVGLRKWDSRTHKSTFCLQNSDSDFESCRSSATTLFNIDSRVGPCESRSHPTNVVEYILDGGDNNLDSVKKKDKKEANIGSKDLNFVEQEAVIWDFLA